MSTPFTVTAQNYWQLDKREELRLALSERVAFILNNISDLHYKKYYAPLVGSFYEYTWTDGDGTVADELSNNQPAHNKGFNIQDYNFYYNQQAIIKMELIKRYGYPDSSYYDSTNKLPSSVYEYIDDPYYEYESYGLDISFNNFLDFCRHCGGTLYTDDTDYGFRRVSSLDTNGDPIFERGQAQINDYLGGWLAEDLRLAYENLNVACMSAGYEAQYSDPYFERSLANTGRKTKSTQLGMYGSAPSVVIEITDTTLTINGDPFNLADYQYISINGNGTNYNITTPTDGSGLTIEQNGGASNTYLVGATEFTITFTVPVITATTNSADNSISFSDILFSSDVGTHTESYLGSQHFVIMYFADYVSEPILWGSVDSETYNSSDTDYNTPEISRVQIRQIQLLMIMDTSLDNVSTAYSMGEIFAQNDINTNGLSTEPSNYYSTIASWADINASNWYSRVFATGETEITHGFYKAYLTNDLYYQTLYFAYTLLPDFTNA